MLTFGSKPDVFQFAGADLLARAMALTLLEQDLNRFLRDTERL
jgi:hypothetical protein